MLPVWNCAVTMGLNKPRADQFFGGPFFQVVAGCAAFAAMSTHSVPINPKTERAGRHLQRATIFRDVVAGTLAGDSSGDFPFMTISVNRNRIRRNSRPVAGVFSAS